MHLPKKKLWDFFCEEDGEIYVGFSYLLTTLVVSIPLGLALAAIYESLCDAGTAADRLIGLF